jgi:antitoxin ParD1/3/4
MRENFMMNITLTLELEQLVKSQLQTGKYATVDQVIAEALLLLEANNRHQAMSQKVKNLFDKTQAIPGVQEITEEEIAAEIDAYRLGE